MLDSMNLEGFLGIITDGKTTKMIEAIEDALGNEIYYFFSKTDRKEFDRQKDFDEERMSVDPFPFSSTSSSSRRYSPREMMLNRIKTLENHVRTMQNQVRRICKGIQWIEILVFSKMICLNIWNV